MFGNVDSVRRVANDAGGPWRTKGEVGELTIELGPRAWAPDRAVRGTSVAGRQGSVSIARPLHRHQR